MGRIAKSPKKAEASTRRRSTRLLDSQKKLANEHHAGLGAINTATETEENVPKKLLVKLCLPKQQLRKFSPDDSTTVTESGSDWEGEPTRHTKRGSPAKKPVRKRKVTGIAEDGEASLELTPQEPKPTNQSSTPQDLAAVPQLPTPLSYVSDESPAKKRRLAPQASPSKQASKAKSENTLSEVTVSLVDTRPDCYAEPEVWARDRPSLCETLPFFNSWQSAACSSAGYVHGMLLDKDEGGRGYIDEEVVIARAGGCMGTSEDDKKRQAKDHDENTAHIKAFYNNRVDRMPLYLIVGNQNLRCPTKVPHRYCVMDLFCIVEIWRERVDGKVAILYRMQKKNLQEKSWWAPVGSPLPEQEPDYNTKAVRQTCCECGEESPKRFSRGWMCGNSKCARFWMIDDKDAGVDLDYDLTWLKERIPWQGRAPKHQMILETLTDFNSTDRLQSVRQSSTTGMVCPQCHGCIIRQHWTAWICQTPGCGFVHEPPKNTIPAAAVIDEGSARFEGPALPEAKFDDTILFRKLDEHGLFRTSRYKLHDGCFVVHIQSNPVINRTPGGPDRLFEKLQEVNLGLKRGRLQARVDGQLARHYNANFGLPYKFVIKTESTAFSDAPPEILEAVRRMTWAGKLVVNDGSFQDFNELLAVGYMQRDKMGFHDDGEDSLGPTVAAMSLGCPSSFKVRLKKKYYTGFGGGKRELKCFDPNLEILPFAFKPAERRRLKDEAGKLSSEALNQRAKQLLVDGKGGVKATPPTILDLTVRHGDIVVMQGADTQKFFEHEANPEGNLRFCLTCRYVKPEMVDQDQLHKGVIPAKYTDPETAYEGDLALHASQEQRWDKKPHLSSTDENRR